MSSLSKADGSAIDPYDEIHYIDKIKSPYPKKGTRLLFRGTTLVDTIDDVQLEFDNGFISRTPLLDFQVISVSSRVNHNKHDDRNASSLRHFLPVSLNNLLLGSFNAFINYIFSLSFLYIISPIGASY